MSEIYMNYLAGRMNFMRLMRVRWLRHHWFIYQREQMHFARLWEDADLEFPIYRKAKKVRKVRA